MPSDFSVSEFLTQLNSVAEDNNFFRPGFTLKELGEIPAIYESIIEDPVALQDKFQNAGGKFEFGILKTYLCDL